MPVGQESELNGNPRNHANDTLVAESRTAIIGGKDSIDNQAYEIIYVKLSKNERGEIACHGLMVDKPFHSLV